VPADKVTTTQVQLAGRGIARGDTVGFEIFDKPNFGISDFIQRANYLRALQGELARTIAQLDDVDKAVVNLVLPENRLLADKDRHPTASVLVRLRGNLPLSPSTVNSIRSLVANAVEGLKPNFVTVVDNKGHSHGETADEDSVAGATANQLAMRRELEAYLSKKAEGMLETVLGPGQAVVRVSADINFETVSRIEEKFDPEGQVIRSQTRNDENMDSTTADTAAAVGVTANTPSASNAAGGAPAPAAAPAAAPNSTKNRKVLGTTEYEIGRTTSNTYQAAGGIKRISSAVTVAARMEGTGADRKAVPRTPEELEKLRRVVQNALGYDTTRGDQVIVEELTFDREFVTELNKRFDNQEKRDFWWGVGRSALYPGVALVILMVLLRLVKRTKVEEFSFGIPVGQFPSSGPGGGGSGGALSASGGTGGGAGKGQVGQGSDWFGEPRVVTVEVLNQLVRENPTNMTGAIRAWLNRGSPPPK
jgi:flagellar M-ring protein FliF